VVALPLDAGLISQLGNRYSESSVPSFGLYDSVDTVIHALNQRLDCFGCNCVPTLSYGGKQLLIGSLAFAHFA